MKDVIKTLRGQHQEILIKLERSEDLLSIISFVEDVHHVLEEEALFPIIAENPMLREGGPMCTYFWGMEMEFSPKTPAQDLLRRLYEKGLEHPDGPQVFPWLHKSSPLSIPMSEHALSAELSHAIRKLSQEPEGGLAREFLSPLKNEYIKLLRAHIDKEDNCLFILCERLLSPN
jgi:hemerythrin-like domain-containing protein